MDEKFDYIIVGAGSAGSVLANRLTNGSNTVCLLEAGGADRTPFIHIPAGFMKTLVNPSVNWLYETEPSEGTAGRNIHAPRGKTLGGSSSINGHIYNRGQHMDFDTWAQLGNRGWSYSDILPYFKRSEKKIGGDDNKYHGRDGELLVTDFDWYNELSESFIDGVTKMGIPRNPDYNGEFQEGVGYFQRTIANGRRISTARAFLNPVRNRPNLEIRTRAHVERIIFEGKKAIGVVYSINNKKFVVRVRKEIILSGGSVNSPQLLQVSGIGPADLLGSLGISVIHDLPAVGQNLSDHYGVRISARGKNQRTINERSRGFNLAKEVANYIFRRKGILSLSPSLVYIFWKSQEIMQNPDLQMIFTPASYKEGVPSQLDDFPGMTVAAWPMRPESTGFVNSRSADIRDKPIIQPNYLEHENDQRVLLAGIKLMRQMLRTPEISKWYDQEEVPGIDVESDNDLLNFARERGTTFFHLVGTCRMGPNKNKNTVVSDELKVHGIESLRVVDASIMPTMPSANTNAPTIMIAEKASDMILGNSPLEKVHI